VAFKQGGYFVDFKASRCIRNIRNSCSPPLAVGLLFHLIFEVEVEVVGQDPISDNSIFY